MSIVQLDRAVEHHRLSCCPQLVFVFLSAQDFFFSSTFTLLLLLLLLLSFFSLSSFELFRLLLVFSLTSLSSPPPLDLIFSAFVQLAASAHNLRLCLYILYLFFFLI